MSNITSVPSIARGNDQSHAIGLGQMNLHGYLARERVHYGSEEGLDFTNIYFYSVVFHAVRASNRLAIQTGQTFGGFEKSKYASGEFFDKYTDQEWVPQTAKVAELFKNIHIPTQDDWRELKASVMEHGIYNQNLQAVPPTGSISYINNSTSSIHPVASKIEIRKEGKLGRVYYPAPYLTNDNLEYYQDAYEIGYEKVIDTYAAATQHVDQGLSLTLFFKDTATTRDINKAQIYAWKKGIKTIYYIRLRQLALEGTEVDGCVCCMLDNRNRLILQVDEMMETTTATGGLVYGIRLRREVEYRYVGITTKTASRRFHQHLRVAAEGRKTPFYDWLRKHDPADLIADELDWIEGLPELGQAEIEWISYLRREGDRLLNLADGGLGPTGVVWTEEHA